jgi:hypothetical protein
VDFAFSEVMLGAGHTYLVCFNDDPNNPRIEEMLLEIPKEPRGSEEA